MSYIFYCIKKTSFALAGCLSWLECHPIIQNVVDLIPAHGIYLG